MTQQDYDLAKLLVSQIFNGVNGKQPDPGMAGSLLYHMAMVTKMESETRMLIEELHVNPSNITKKLNNIYCDFQSDAKDLTKEITTFTLNPDEIVSNFNLGTAEKIILFNKLTAEKKTVEKLLNHKSSGAREALEHAFLDWTNEIIRMRLIQEYETIKGLLVTVELADKFGLPKA